MLKHIADAESEFVVVNVNPDFCEVDGCVVGFDIHQELTKERADYSPDVFSRGGKVLHVGSIVKGVQGNAGKGIESGVSQGDGDVIVEEGSKLLFVNGKAVAHHGHRVTMNVKT
jgi:uncharacterized Zn-binding protein involved in type VI secretion